MSKLLTKLFPNIINKDAMDTEKDTIKIKDTIRKSGVQITLYVVGITFAIINLWLASKLSPLVQDIELLRTKVYALETKRSQDDIDTKVLLQEFYTNKAIVDTINETTKRIESKLDQHLIKD